MSYRLRLNTNYHFFKSDEDVKKFIENIDENPYYYAKYEDTDSEEFFKKIKHFPMDIFFKSSCTNSFYALMQIFEDVNFSNEFLATIRDLEDETIIVFIVKPNNKIQVLYHKWTGWDDVHHKLTNEVDHEEYEYDLKSYWED